MLHRWNSHGEGHSRRRDIGMSRYVAWHCNAEANASQSRVDLERVEPCMGSPADSPTFRLIFCGDPPGRGADRARSGTGGEFAAAESGRADYSYFLHLKT
jgi:hypothetical protein